MAEETHKVTGQSGQLITLPTLESLGWRKEGYVFRGWGKTRDAKIIETRDGGTVQYDNSTNLYALWASTDCFYLKAQEDNASFYMTDNNGQPPSVSLEYSLDNKQTWTEWSDKGTAITLTNIGDIAYIRAKNKNKAFGRYIQTYGTAHYWSFVITGGKMSSGGNIMSLLDKDMLQTNVPEYAFVGLFRLCTSLVSTPKLPATTLGNHCYDAMFDGCSNLIYAPDELPATDAYAYCYQNMFRSCSKLETVPNIRLNTL